MKSIGTEDGFGLVGYYVDPLEETEELKYPECPMIARHTFLKDEVCWCLWFEWNKN